MLPDPTIRHLDICCLTTFDPFGVILSLLIWEVVVTVLGVLKLGFYVLDVP